MKNKIKKSLLIGLASLALASALSACSDSNKSGPKPHPNNPHNTVIGDFSGSNTINSSNSIDGLSTEISSQGFCDHSHHDLRVKITGSGNHFTAVVDSKSQGHGVTMSCTHKDSNKVLSCSSNVGPYKTTWTGRHNGSSWSGRAGGTSQCDIKLVALAFHVLDKTISSIFTKHETI